VRGPHDVTVRALAKYFEYQNDAEMIFEDQVLDEEYVDFAYMYGKRPD
jgi:hypothetical protein